MFRYDVLPLPSHTSKEYWPHRPDKPEDFTKVIWTTHSRDEDTVWLQVRLAMSVERLVHETDSVNNGVELGLRWVVDKLLVERCFGVVEELR